MLYLLKNPVRPVSIVSVDIDTSCVTKSSLKTWQLDEIQTQPKKSVPDLSTNVVNRKKVMQNIWN